jgi:hypothetical protein
MAFIFFFFLNAFVINAEESIKLEVKKTEAEIYAESIKTDYKMDWKYSAGEYLIYDCERKHFACIDKSSQENCVEERAFALAQKLPSLPCAPLKKYTDKTACVHENYKVVDINALKRFCYPK